MREAIPIGKVAGFPVRVHCSVPVILSLFTWSLASTCPTLCLAPTASFGRASASAHRVTTPNLIYS